MNVHYSIVQQISDRFSRWEKHIRLILKRFDNYATVNDVYKDCIECRKLLFENEKAFAIVNVLDHPQDRYLFVQFAGGTPEGFDELDPAIAQFGRNIGASKAIFIGRKGFAKVMSKRGWKQRFVYMEKEIP